MENEVLQLLETNKGTPFSAKEVGKKLDRQQWQENPWWARPVLERMVSSHLIEKTSEGFYLSPKGKY